jgi:hypothetical protein
MEDTHPRICCSELRSFQRQARERLVSMRGPTGLPNGRRRLPGKHQACAPPRYLPVPITSGDRGRQKDADWACLMQELGIVIK